MAQRPYDPDHYLTSSIRALQDYITAAFDSDLVTVIPEFPPPGMWKVPIASMIVHLELDDDDPQPFGFGTFARTTYDPVTVTSVVEEATAWYVLNFDVGIWAFEEVGGATARMEAHETLKQLFIGNQADLDLAAATNGIHVVSFSGGRHIIDEVNGLPVWRAIDMTLIVRVAGRRTFAATDAIGDYTQDPQLVIDVDPTTGIGTPVTTP